MAAIAWSDITTAPGGAGLAGVDPVFQTALLAFVNGALDVRLFADGEADARLHLARIYLAAHYATMTGGANGVSSGGGPAGPVTSASAGRIARQFGSWTASPSDPVMSLTSWGRAYRALIRPQGGGITL